MLYFSALLMLKYSIWWRPSMLGGRLFLPLLRSCFRILLYLFRKKFFLYVPWSEKKVRVRNIILLIKRGRYFWEGCTIGQIPSRLPSIMTFLQTTIDL